MESKSNLNQTLVELSHFFPGTQGETCPIAGPRA